MLYLVSIQEPDCEPDELTSGTVELPMQEPDAHELASTGSKTITIEHDRNDKRTGILREILDVLPF